MKFLNPYHPEPVIKFTHMPLSGMNALGVSQGFGLNGVAFYKEMGMLGHNGQDLKIKTQNKDACYAVCNGIIASAQMFGDGGYGIYINTPHFKWQEQEMYLQVVYYHLYPPLGRKQGEPILGGEELAFCDNTGKYTTGAHLHFGVKAFYKREDGVWIKDDTNGFKGAINPEPFYATKEFELLPVDTRYGRAIDKIAEGYWNAVHRKYAVGRLAKYGRKLGTREFNGFVYGKWDIDTILNDALFVTWTIKPKK